ncbi:methionine adenosyltransferase [soil metagenome]|nr:methionine adenosyltransferase [Deinococcota bacterium]
MRKLLTSESVTEGHPDKLADRISDGVLDAMLVEDPHSRVAAETVVTTGMVFITGEISCRGYVDIQRIVRDSVREVGYTESHYGIDADHCAVLVAIDEQSPDIAQGVSRAQDAGSGDPFDQVGAGDQGMMFGYASHETPELMPLPIMLAHGLTSRLAELRKSGALSYLRPDGKAQVTVAYQDDRPVSVTSAVISTQHDEDVTQDELVRDIRERLVKAVIPEQYLKGSPKLYINPTGRFVIGGPQADSGLTGRKIVVDTYGGAVPHGGGAFSGKDPTKVDRSASYYARYMAKNVVAAGLAERCLIQLAYAIGVAQPVGMFVDCFGTGKLPDDALGEVLGEVFDARPAAIIHNLGLNAPIYKATSAYGHFGREGFPWERTDKAGLLEEEALTRA